MKAKLLYDPVPVSFEVAALLEVSVAMAFCHK